MPISPSSTVRELLDSVRAQISECEACINSTLVPGLPPATDTAALALEELSVRLNIIREDIDAHKISRSTRVFTEEEIAKESRPVDHFHPQ